MGNDAFLGVPEVQQEGRAFREGHTSARNQRTGGSHPRMESFPLVQNTAKRDWKRAKERRLLDTGAPQLRKRDTGNQIFALKFMEKNWFDD
jgi:hypothetical protein